MNRSIPDPMPYVIYIDHHAVAARSPRWFRNDRDCPVEINTVFNPRAGYSQEEADYA